MRAPKKKLVKKIKSKKKAKRRGDQNQGVANPRMVWLRKLAGVLYTTNERGMSLVELSKQSEFSDISEVTLSRWCSEDQWVDKRKKYFEGLANSLKARIGNEIVSSRIQGIKEVDGLLEELSQKLLPYKNLSGEVVEPVPIKSFEGGVKAFALLLELKLKLQDIISDNVRSISSAERNTEMLHNVKLDKEETRAAIKAIMKHRRGVHRKLIERSDENSKEADSDANG